MTDGELFYIIENGVRFTGMPAFATGTAEGEEESWKLVHFIRRLPQLSGRTRTDEGAESTVRRKRFTGDRGGGGFLRGSRYVETRSTA